MSTLHLHFDESGDLSFTPKSGKYFVLTVAWTYDPHPLAMALTRLRFRFIRRGHNIESFHASPDTQLVRDHVVRVMLEHADWRFAAVVLEKRKVNPSLRPPEKFYPFFAGSLLKFVFRGSAYRPGTSRVLVYADTIPMRSNAQREGVLKAIKQTCARELPPNLPHHVVSHCRQSNAWLQAVDYCCWSVATKWERSEARTYNQLLPHRAASELCVTDRGDQTIYY